jgi:uncharacterized protein YndB with AHSA1/START domain
MTSLRIDRTLPAPTVRVWSALTDETALAAWFWPASLHPRASADEAGYALTGDNLAVRGRYLEFAPPHRLRFTWHWDGEEAETVVSIDMSGVDGATELTLRHDGFADVDARDAHITGWTQCLDRLPAYLAGSDDSPETDKQG